MKLWIWRQCESIRNRHPKNVDWTVLGSLERPLDAPLSEDYEDYELKCRADIWMKMWGQRLVEIPKKPVCMTLEMGRLVEVTT